MSGRNVVLTRCTAWRVPTVATIRAAVERRLSPTTVPVALSTLIPESGERKKTGAGVISAPLKLKAWTIGRTTAPVVSRRVSPTTTDGEGSVSNWSERTDVELPLTSEQAAATIETMTTASTTHGRSFILKSRKSCNTRAKLHAR